MQTKAQRKAAAEPHLEAAAVALHTAKACPTKGPRKPYHEHAAHQITKANQILKGKTHV